MKAFLKLFILLFFSFYFINPVFSTTPIFNLRAMNYIFVSDNILEFDVNMQWTNSGSSDPFMYGAGQYFLNYNTGIL